MPLGGRCRRLPAQTDAGSNDQQEPQNPAWASLPLLLTDRGAEVIYLQRLSESLAWLISRESRRSPQGRARGQDPQAQSPRARNPWARSVQRSPSKASSSAAPRPSTTRSPPSMTSTSAAASDRRPPRESTPPSRRRARSTNVPSFDISEPSRPARRHADQALALVPFYAGTRSRPRSCAAAQTS